MAVTEIEGDQIHLVQSRCVKLVQSWCKKLLYNKCTTNPFAQ